MNDIELTSILCFYYFDKAKNLDLFTKRYNQYFRKDVSAQTILFEVAKINSNNPINNRRKPGVDIEYQQLWDRYITAERIKDLKELYSAFKDGISSKPSNEGDYEISQIRISIYDTAPTIRDLSEEKPQERFSNGGYIYPRSIEVVNNALACASYLCEGECETKLFSRKDERIPYTEAHHIIPLCYQDEFAYSLDIEANVVSLCPMCHKMLHHGSDIDDLLKQLYTKRSQRLLDCGLSVSYGRLRLLYR